MGLSVLEIWNRALGLIGTRTDISSLTEASREAEQCSLWYDSVRREVLAAAHWGEARATASLGLLAERSSSTWTDAEPTPPWQYAYGRPSDCVHPRFLSDESIFEVGVQRLSNTDYNALLTNTPAAILIYTKDQTNTGMWSAWLTSAAFYALAARIIRPLSGGGKKTQELIAEANAYILRGREVNANQDTVTYEVLPDWLIARGYGGGVHAPNRYIYQVGPLLVG